MTRTLVSRARPVALAALAACVFMAAPAAAQDLSNAEIEDYIQDRCRDLSARYRNIDLTMRLPNNFRSPTQRIRNRLPEYWANPGYLLLTVRYSGVGDSHNYAVPLSSVSIEATGNTTVRFECIDRLPCIFFQRNRLANTRDPRTAFSMQCRVRDGVIRAFEAYIDRNVTRMTWEDPFAE